jgi:hypothetical protein
MEQDERYRRAKKRVDEIKSFWTHFGIYVMVMVILVLVDRYADNIPNTWWVQWPAMGWGIAIVIHAFTTYSPFSTAAWEQRKIKELMEKDSQR